MKRKRERDGRRARAQGHPARVAERLQRESTRRREHRPVDGPRPIQRPWADMIRSVARDLGWDLSGPFDEYKRLCASYLDDMQAMGDLDSWREVDAETIEILPSERAWSEA